MIMEKRTYIQPRNEVEALNPMQVLCVSEIVNNTPQDNMSADAPKPRHRTEVF